MSESADHEIVIRRVGNEAVPPDPMPSMFTYQTVRYSSPDGTVIIDFPSGSPFDETRITGPKIVTLRHVGKFRCRCFIKLPDGEEVGWTSDPRPSGADHDVPH